MSSKIEAILPHHLESFEEVEQLLEALRPVLDPAMKLHEAYWESSDNSCGTFAPAWHMDTWSLPLGLTPRQNWEAGKGPRIFGPQLAPEQATTWLVFGRQCLFVTTPIKWLVALAQPRLLEAAAEYFRALAVALGSEAFILYRYNGAISWDWVLNGLSLEEIEQRFRKTGSKPATSVGSLPLSSTRIERTRHYLERISI